MPAWRFLVRGASAGVAVCGSPFAIATVRPTEGHETRQRPRRAGPEASQADDVGRARPVAPACADQDVGRIAQLSERRRSGRGHSTLRGDSLE